MTSNPAFSRAFVFSPTPRQHCRPAHLPPEELFPGARLYSMYGLTECNRCTYLPPEELDRRPGSVGIAIPNTEAFVVDDEGDRVPPVYLANWVIRGPACDAGLLAQ